MLADGYHDLPEGKIAAIVTSLEMTAPPLPRPEVENPRGRFTGYPHRRRRNIWHSIVP